MVSVVLVEPGFVQSAIASSAKIPSSPLDIYAALVSGLRTGLHRDVAHGIDPEVVASRVSEVLGSPSPQLLQPVENEARKVRHLKQLLPSAIFEAGLRKCFGV